MGFSEEETSDLLKAWFDLNQRLGRNQREMAVAVGVHAAQVSRWKKAVEDGAVPDLGEARWKQIERDLGRISEEEVLSEFRAGVQAAYDAMRPCMVVIESMLGRGTAEPGLELVGELETQWKPGDEDRRKEERRRAGSDRRRAAP